MSLLISVKKGQSLATPKKVMTILIPMPYLPLSEYFIYGNGINRFGNYQVSGLTTIKLILVISMIYSSISFSCELQLDLDKLTINSEV